jgi:hypothetical protein
VIIWRLLGCSEVCYSGLFNKSCPRVGLTLCRSLLFCNQFRLLDCGLLSIVFFLLLLCGQGHHPGVGAGLSFPQFCCPRLCQLLLLCRCGRLLLSIDCCLLLRCLLLETQRTTRFSRKAWLRMGGLERDERQCRKKRPAAMGIFMRILLRDNAAAVSRHLRWKGGTSSAGQLLHQRPLQRLITTVHNQYRCGA